MELAVLLPFLTFLFLITVDWSRIFYYTVTLDNCAYNAALFASSDFNNPQWQGASGQISSAKDAAVVTGASLHPALTASDVTIVNGSDANGNTIVTATVTYSFKPLAPFPGIPSTQTIVRKAQMRIAPATPS